MLRFFESIEDVSIEEWESVLARSLRPSPFSSPRFLVPWSKHFGQGRDVRIARWEREGVPGGFVFLCRKEGGNGWELFGGEDVSDSQDAVVAAGEEEPFWEEFLRAAPEALGPCPLRIPNLVEGSPSIGLLPGICGKLGIGLTLSESDRSPYIPLPGGFDEYIAQLGKKERHELRRKLRRAAESDPDISFRVTGTRDELERDFPSFVALHRLSHPEKLRFMDARMERFFRDVAEGFFASGRLRLSFLSGRKGDVASAFQIESDGAVHLYNSGFDPGAVDGTSPGLVLLSRCIEDAIGRGIAEYDFLRGRERYKYDLGARDRSVYMAVLRIP